MSQAHTRAGADDALVPQRLPRLLREDWHALGAPTLNPAVFEPSMLAGLPAPARRWLDHAIKPGTSLCRAACFAEHGQIKVGRWQRFEADWVLAPTRGYIWAARTRLGPLSIHGFDRYTEGVGEMRWRLFGRIPFLGMTGTDVSRSAMGRLAAELVFVPAAALSPAARWEAVDHDRAEVCVDAHGWTHRVTLTVAPSGALERVDVSRWDHPDGKPFREHLFTAVMNGDEVSFDGFTIPAEARAGWWHCPDRCASEEFIRLTIDQASYR